MFVAICKHLPVASSCLHGLAPWIQPVWSLSFEVQPYGHAKWSNGSWCIRAQCPTWKKPSFLQCNNLSADHWSDAWCFGHSSIMLHHTIAPGQQGLFDGGLWTCRWSVGTQQRYDGRRFSLCAIYQLMTIMASRDDMKQCEKTTQPKTCDVPRRCVVVACCGNDLDVNSIENT